MWRCDVHLPTFAHMSVQTTFALASTKLAKVILARHPAVKSVHLATLRLVRASKPGQSKAYLSPALHKP